jgi:hypothetical protein
MGGPKRDQAAAVSSRVPSVGPTIPDVPPAGASGDANADADAAPLTPRSLRAPPSLFSNADLGQLRALEKVALFANQDGDDDSDDMAGGNSFEAPAAHRRPWWRARRFVEGMIALAVAAAFAVTAGALQATIWVSHRRATGAGSGTNGCRRRGSVVELLWGLHHSSLAP